MVKKKFLDLYMTLAQETAKLSHARRLKVGSVIVKDHRVISLGYNGMPAGWDNVCEIEIKQPVDRVDYVTKDEVIHAEANAIIKLARDGESGKDATLFLTHAPCIHCAKMIFGAGISKVYYKEDYRDDSGKQFLIRSGVDICKLNDD
jgi:dCMP deaminase